MKEAAVVSLRMPKTLLELLDNLVEMGVFNSRSEAIRIALIRFLTNDIAHVLEMRERMMRWGR